MCSSIPKKCLQIKGILDKNGFPQWLRRKDSACKEGDSCSITGSGRSPGGGHGNPLQYPSLEKPMDRGAWRATVHMVTESWTWLKQHPFTINRVFLSNNFLRLRSSIHMELGHSIILAFNYACKTKAIRNKKHRVWVIKFSIISSMKGSYVHLNF